MKIRIAKARWFEIEVGQRWAHRYNKRTLTVTSVEPDPRPDERSPGERGTNEVNYAVGDIDVEVKSKTGRMWAISLVRNWVLLPDTDPLD